MEQVQSKVGKPRIKERGQSLTEYALVLVLVAVAVILITVIFGKQVQKTYCKVAFSLDPNIDAPFCLALDVNCTTLSASPFRFEAVVTDNAGDNNVTQVQFFVDGLLYNTEVRYHYCLQGGDDFCVNYTGPHGQHTISAVASDGDGNTGRCSVTTTIP